MSWDFFLRCTHAHKFLSKVSCSLRFWHQQQRQTDYVAQDRQHVSQERYGCLTLVARGRRALHAAWQIRPAGEHPALAGGRISKRHPCELPWEVYGEGPQTAVRILMRVCGPPARLLFDEGVGGKRSVRGGRVKVQHRSPLRSSADGQGTVRVPPGQSRDRWKQGAQVSDVRSHQVTRLSQHLGGFSSLQHPRISAD